MRSFLLAASLAAGGVLLPLAASGQSELASRHFTTSDSVELHYLEAGSGPPLVFVPGWTMPAWIWEPQLEHFASDYRVLGYVRPAINFEIRLPTAVRWTRPVCPYPQRAVYDGEGDPDAASSFECVTPD